MPMVIEKINMKEGKMPGTLSGLGSTSIILVVVYMSFRRDILLICPSPALLFPMSPVMEIFFV